MEDELDCENVSGFDHTVDPRCSTGLDAREVIIGT